MQDDEIETNEDQTEHYHSYHLYSVYESLHKPIVACRPGSARTLYLRTCEDESTAPLPIFDHIRQGPSGLVEVSEHFGRRDILYEPLLTP